MSFVYVINYLSLSCVSLPFFDARPRLYAALISPIFFHLFRHFRIGSLVEQRRSLRWLRTYLRAQLSWRLKSSDRLII